MANQDTFNPFKMIPISWTITKLKDLSYKKQSIIRGRYRCIKGGKSAKSRSEKLIPIIQPFMLTTPIIDFSETRFFIDNKLVDYQFIINLDDIIIGRVIGSKAKKFNIGKLTKDQQVATVSPNCYIIRVDPSLIRPDYLIWYLSSNYVQNYLRSRTPTANITTLQISVLQNLDVIIPPLLEQKKIVKLLNSIESQISVKENLIDLYYNLAQCIFSNKIVEHIHEPGLIRTLKLGDVIKIQSGRKIKKDENGKTPIYGPGGIIGYSNQQLDSNEGMIITGKAGTIGKLYLCNTPVFPNNNTFYVTFQENDVSIFYWYYYLKFLQLNRLKVGRTIPYITKNILQNLEIYMPSDWLMEIISHQQKNIYNKIQSLKSQKGNYKKLQSLLLTSLFFGKYKFHY